MPRVLSVGVHLRRRLKHCCLNADRQRHRTGERVRALSFSAKRGNVKNEGYGVGLVVCLSDFKGLRVGKDCEILSHRHFGSCCDEQLALDRTASLERATCYLCCLWSSWCFFSQQNDVMEFALVNENAWHWRKSAP